MKKIVKTMKVVVYQTIRHTREKYTLIRSYKKPQSTQFSYPIENVQKLYYHPTIKETINYPKRGTYRVPQTMVKPSKMASSQAARDKSVWTNLSTKP